MLCYRDMTFCASDCTNRRCPRFFGPDQSAGARQWWSHNPDNAPVAFSDFSGDCTEYQAPKEAA